MSRDLFIERGTAMGYPKCCIEFFIAGFAKMGVDDWMGYIVTTPLYGTGLVTCPKCRHDVKSVLLHINKHRDPKLPRFPEA